MRLALDLPGGRTLQTEVDPAEADEGRALLERLAAQAGALPAGETAVVEIDWAVLQLRAGPGTDGATVTAGEPDYHADPTAFVASLVLTSRIRAAERRLLRALGVAGAPVGARQFVRVAAEALQATSVVGVRQAESEAPFTGWQVVPVSGLLPNGTPHGLRHGQYGLHTVQELAALRLAWMAALGLPAGWAFRFAGRSLADAVAPDGTTHELGFLVEV